VYRFQHFVPKWIESHQRRLAGTPAFRRRLIELAHPSNTFHIARLIGRRHWVLGARTEGPGVVPARNSCAISPHSTCATRCSKRRDEMDQFGLAHTPSRLVRPPRAAASPHALDAGCCRSSISRTCKDDHPPATSHSDKCGRPIARCGYADYSVVDKVFAMARPKVLFPKQDAAK